MDEELKPSCLGLYEYWEEVYNNEIINFENYGDVGEVWFGKATAKKIVKWIYEHSVIQKNDSILDIGCGNGMLLMDLHSKGFKNLHGIDYSAKAIDLASAISKSKQYSVKFSVSNILEDTFELSYHVVLDKGTYDAICLDPKDSRSKRQFYIRAINNILKVNGYFIIASCNWTEAELLSQFNGLNHVETLPAPTIQFGGKSGNTVTTVIFQKLLITV